MTDESDPNKPDQHPIRDIGKGLLDQGMGSSSSLAHLYRGEIHRMKFWRERLDRTTNWAVIIMAAILTWSFSSESNPYYVILVGWAAVSVFLITQLCTLK